MQGRIENMMRHIDLFLLWKLISNHYAIREVILSSQVKIPFWVIMNFFWGLEASWRDLNVEI